MGRWDFLYEQKPRPAVEVLLDEAARVIADDLARWPPPLEAADPSLAPLLAGDRPHPDVFRQAFALARLDLRHEYEELERREAESRLAPEEIETARFLWRYLAERVFDLNEAVQSRLTRRHLVELLDRVERRLLAPTVAIDF
jgi:hypothetical protein